jgi:predicted kinase
MPKAKQKFTQANAKGQREEPLQMIPKASQPLMICIGGMSGSGKTTLAMELANRIPNSVVLDSDEVRKMALGVPRTQPLPDSAYSPENTKKHIRRMHREAEYQLQAGKTVIVTGVFLDRDSRGNQENLAKENNVKFIGIFLDAPMSVLFERVAERKKVASDATPAIVRRQKHTTLMGQRGKQNWQTINADQPKEDVTRAAIAYVSRKTANPNPSRKKPAAKPFPG